jgi:Ca2+-binding EF-hand superfamily protein
MKISLLSSPKLGETSNPYKVIFRSLMVKKTSCMTPLSEEDLAYLTRKTKEDKTQIEAQYKIFLTNHPDGDISRKSIQRMLSESFPRANVNKVSKHIWRMFDIDNNGLIDFKEFSLVLHVMSHGSSKDNLKQIFRVFDMNRDGKIDPKEMKEIVKNLSKLDEAEKDKIDIAKYAFREMDENQDGKVSRREFMNACLEKKKFSTMLALKIINIFIKT